MIRKIVHIDEERCDGCGLCAQACAEGAIRIVGGKAKLVSDVYCDGLGACIGECPRDAIAIVEREAEAFDEDAVRQHLSQPPTGGAKKGAGYPGESYPRGSAGEGAFAGGCPSAAARELRVGPEVEDAPAGEEDPGRSRLRNWPVQLRLIPVNAPYLQGARLLLAADCLPFALAGFHRRLLDGKVLLIGCPKLDDAAFYRDKLADILKRNDIRELVVAFMEVPCCFGLVNLARQAVAESRKNIPFSTVKVGIAGEILEAGEPSFLSA